MAPLEGPHKKKTEGARKKAAPLATALSAKRTTRVKADQPPKAVALPDIGARPVTAVVVAEDVIRLSAYFKWLRAGRPECDGVSFWLEAERELLAAT